MRLHMTRWFGCLAIAAAVTPRSDAADAPATRPTFDRSFHGARSEVYRTIGDVTLRVHIFVPPGHASGPGRPAIVFFFGGGWRRGSAVQFIPQCRYFASRGMVAITADYRVYDRHGVNVADCVADAQSAVRWVRANAKRLGVDPERIAAAGGSAGGHLAAATAMLKDFTDAADDRSVSYRPNALVLFNPALDLVPIEKKADGKAPRMRGVARRLGADALALSPYRHITAGAPPTIVLHGKNDRLIPYRQVEAFAEAMTRAGVRCELIGFEGKGHGFFNYDPKDNRCFVETLRQADRFLASLGWLFGPPTVGSPAPRTQPAASR
jgi:acetyl esterase